MPRASPPHNSRAHSRREASEARSISHACGHVRGREHVGAAVHGMPARACPFHSASHTHLPASHEPWPEHGAVPGHRQHTHVTTDPGSAPIRFEKGRGGEEEKGRSRRREGEGKEGRGAAPLSGDDGHDDDAQSTPAQLGAHTHAAAMHWPWGAEHPFGQSSVSHASPVYCAAHSHLPSLHRPRAEPPHSFRHVECSQYGGR